MEKVYILSLVQNRATSSIPLGCGCMGGDGALVVALNLMCFLFQVVVKQPLSFVCSPSLGRSYFGNGII